MDPNTTVPQGENIPPQVPQDVSNIQTNTDPADVPAQPSPVNTPSVTPSLQDSPVPPPLNEEPVSGQPQMSNAPMNPVGPAKKSSPIFIVALVLLLLSVFALGGYYLWTKYSGSLESSQTPTITPTVIPTLVPTETPTLEPSASPSASPTIEATSSDSPTASPSASD